MQQESGHALFVVCVNELAAEVGVLCRLVNDLFVVAFDAKLLCQKSCYLSAA